MTIDEQLKSNPKPTPPHQSSPLHLLIMAAVGLAVYYGFGKVPVETRVGLYSGTIAGALVGLVPFFIAKRKKQPGFALLAVSSCGISGAVLGLLLAIPVAIGFSIGTFCRANKDSSR